MARMPNFATAEEWARLFKIPEEDFPNTIPPCGDMFHPVKGTAPLYSYMQVKKELGL